MRAPRLYVAVSALVLAALAAHVHPALATDPAPYRLVGYFTEWGIYDRKYDVADVPADKLTHLNYAFAKIEHGECAIVDSYAAIDKAYPGDTWDAGVLRGNFKQLQLLKRKHPRLKTLISVGGWTLSGPFSDVALTDGARKKFARSCVAFITKYGFDGVDIDWEYPGGGGLEGNQARPEDKTNFTLLLAELRKHLDERGRADKTHYLLTIAAPSGPQSFAHIELSKIHPLLDWLNLMTYDFHGGWSDLTGHNAGLFPSKGDRAPDAAADAKLNADSAVKAYRAAGVPAEKIVLGAPFYGRGWSGVKDATHGLGQPHDSQLPQGTWEAGVWDYRDLAAHYVDKKAKRFWDDAAKVPWLFDAKSGLMISYDDAESMTAKARYVRANKLGGVMVWELSGDGPRAELLTALHAGLTRP